MTEVEQQTRLVSDFKIECVFVSDLAAFIHGASIRTPDLNVCYSRDKANLIRIAEGLRSVNALRRSDKTPIYPGRRNSGAGPELPF